MHKNKKQKNTKKKGEAIPHADRKDRADVSIAE